MTKLKFAGWIILLSVVIAFGWLFVVPVKFIVDFAFKYLEKASSMIIDKGNELEREMRTKG